MKTIRVVSSESVSIHNWPRDPNNYHTSVRNCMARQCSPLRRKFMECYIIKPAQSLLMKHLVIGHAKTLLISRLFIGHHAVILFPLVSIS